MYITFLSLDLITYFMNAMSNFTNTIEEITAKQQYICLYDSDLNMIDCCANYAALMGKEDIEVVGKSVEEIYTSVSNERRTQFNDVLATGISSSVAIQFTSTTNKIIEIEEQICRLNTGLVVIGKDITASNKEKKKKEEQEYALSLIAKNSSQYFLLVDPKGTILFIDKTYPAFKLEEVIGSNVKDYHKEEDNLLMQKSIETALRTKKESVYELNAHIGNNEYSTFEGTVSPIIEENGDILKLAITTIGITERKKFENELKAINTQYTDLLKLTNSIAFTQDKALRYTSILNPNGILDENLALGKTDRDLIKPFDEAAEKLEAIKLEVLQTGKVIRKDIKLNINKEAHYFDLLIQPLFNEEKETIGISCTSINITDRTNRKEALIENERKLNEAEEIAQLGYYDIDTASRNINWSEETYRIVGVSPKHYVPHLDNFLDLVYEEDRDFVEEAFNEITKTGKNLDVTYRIPGRDKKPIYIRNLAKTRQDTKGQIINIFGTIQDITQQIELELELKAQQAFIQKIVDYSPSLIFILDIEKKENIFLNNASERLLGYSKEEVCRNHNLFLNQLSNLSLSAIKNNNLTKESTTFLSFIHPAERQLFIQFVHMFVEDESDRVFDLNFRHQHKQGHWMWLHHRLIAFNRNKEGKVTQLLGIVSDISSLKEAEKKSKLAMIEGQEKERERMAKDLHDAINPLLSAAKLNVESLQFQTKAYTDQQTNITNIVSLLSQSMTAIKDISFNLMPSILKDFGLVFTLKDYCNKISEGGLIQVNLDIHGVENRLDKVKEVMLFRIAQELINNVIKHAQASQIDVQLIKHQKTIILMVEDNGKGMEDSENISASIGYGLKNVESRAKALNGTMAIDTIKNRGTIITIEIPRK